MNKLFLTLAATALMAVSASAVPINLTVVSTGDLTPSLTHGAQGNQFVTINPTGPFTLFCSGANASLCTGGSANLTTGPDYGAGQTEIWTFGNVTYTTSSISLVNGNASGTANGIQSTGTYTAAGFDATVGTFNISFQSGNQTAITNSNSLSWSAQGTTAPEPGSMALMGSGLIGLALAARRRLKK